KRLRRLKLQQKAERDRIRSINANTFQKIGEKQPMDKEEAENERLWNMSRYNQHKKKSKKQAQDEEIWKPERETIAFGEQTSAPPQLHLFDNENKRSRKKTHAKEHQRDNIRYVDPAKDNGNHHSSDITERKVNIKHLSFADLIKQRAQNIQTNQIKQRYQLIKQRRLLQLKNKLAQKKKQKPKVV
ncbi:hypothetical protein RFI_12689, partial [Reticulomyxa filosa]